MSGKMFSRRYRLSLRTLFLIVLVWAVCCHLIAFYQEDLIRASREEDSLFYFGAAQVERDHTYRLWLGPFRELMPSRFGVTVKCTISALDSSVPCQTEFSPDMIRRIAVDLPHLRHLKLRGYKVSYRSAIAVRSLMNLETLDLGHCNVDCDAWQELQRIAETIGVQIVGTTIEFDAAGNAHAFQKPLCESATLD